MFRRWLEALQARQDLTGDDASAAMDEIMSGRATSAQIAGFLLALRAKGERPAEVVGLARSMRRHAVKLSRKWPNALDTCGTGGDGSGSFNVSSIAALVAAGAGVKVAKHGNRSVSSRCGSADLFEALGVAVTSPPHAAEACLERAGVGFFFAPTFHPAMRHAAPTRRELGVGTTFNLLGPLTNPAGARRQLVGVPRPDLTELMARALGLLGSERVWVVHGADGLDEVSTTGHTKVSEYWQGVVRTFYVHPIDFGVRKAVVGDLAGGDAGANADIARAVLDGEHGPRRDVVVLNAGIGLMVAGHAPTVSDGLALAGAAIDSGAAKAALETMVATSREGVG